MAAGCGNSSLSRRYATKSASRRRDQALKGLPTIEMSLRDTKPIR